MTSSDVAVTTVRVGNWDLLLAAGAPGAATGLAVIHYVPPVELIVAWREYRHARWVEDDKPPARDVKSRRLWLRQDTRRWRGEATPPRIADAADPSARPAPLAGAPAVWLSTTLCRIDNRRWHAMVTERALAEGAYGHDRPERDVEAALCVDCRRAVALGADGGPAAGSLRAFMELPLVVSEAG